MKKFIKETGLKKSTNMIANEYCHQISDTFTYLGELLRNLQEMLETLNHDAVSHLKSLQIDTPLKHDLAVVKKELEEILAAEDAVKKDNELASKFQPILAQIHSFG